MRKHTLFLMLLVLISFKAYPQISFGIKGGANYVNNVSSDSDNDNMFRFGFHFGISSSIQLSNKFLFSPGLMFSNKGFKFAGLAGGTPSGDGTMHLNYLNLPLIIGYKFHEKLLIEGGTEFGYLMSAKSKFDSETIDVSDIWDNNLDIGLLLGFKVLLNDKIDLGLRYIHGLTSVVETVGLTDLNGNPTNGDSSKFLNRTIQLSLGYTFN
ncbi:porin family protein [Reichenbachiella sp.]|uniref:porin family protein n=1 Tax=Reichenbachiella sp. TaxID=2184521 RepID=UPI003BB0BACC